MSRKLTKGKTARTDESFDSGRPKMAGAGDAEAAGGASGGESLGNIGDIVSTGKVYGAKVVDGEKASNRGDKLINLPNGKVAVSADIVFPDSRPQGSKGDYSLNKPDTSINNIEESHIYIGGSSGSPSDSRKQTKSQISSSSKDYAGKYDKSGTKSDAPGSSIRKIEESVININGPTVPGAKPVIPGIGKIEESVINIDQPKSDFSVKPKHALDLKAKNDNKMTPDSIHPIVKNVEESTINIKTIGPGPNAKPVKSESKDYAGKYDKSGTKTDAPGSSIRKIEESVINISGPTVPGAKPVIPGIGKIEESIINIDQPKSDFSVKQKYTQDLKVKNDNKMTPDGIHPIVKDVEESTINIHTIGPGPNAEPIKNEYPSTEHMTPSSKIEKPTLTINNVPVDKPRMKMSNIEESTININNKPAITDKHIAKTLPGKINNIEESIVNINNGLRNKGDVDKYAKSPSSGTLSNIEESTVNFNTNPAYKGNIATMGTNVNGIEESTVNIGGPTANSSGKKPRYPSTSSIVQNDQAGNSHVSNIEESTVNVNGPARVSNIEESRVNIAGTGYPDEPRSLASGSATVTGIEESTVNVGGSAGGPYGSSSSGSYRKKRRAPYVSSGDVSSITSPSGSGTHVANIEESSVNINGIPLSNPASVSGIEESRVNIGGSEYQPNQGNTAPGGTSVTGIEESTVNIGGSANGPYGSSTSGSYRKKRQAPYGNSESPIVPAGSGTHVSNIEESSVNINGAPIANPASVSNIEESKVNIGGSGYPPNQGNTSPGGTSVTGIEESTVNIGGSVSKPYGSSPLGSYRKKRRSPYGGSVDGSSITAPSGSGTHVSNIEESSVNIKGIPFADPASVSNIEESKVNIGGSGYPPNQGIAAPVGTSVTGIEESTVNIGGSAGEPYGSSSSGSYRKKRRAPYGSSGDGSSITSPFSSGTHVSNIEESSVNINGIPDGNPTSVSGIEESRVNIVGLGYPSNQGNTAPGGTSVTGIEESTVNIGGSAGEPYGSSSSGSYRKKRRAPYGGSGDGWSITSPSGSGTHISNIEESSVNINGIPVAYPASVSNIEESKVNIGGSGYPPNQGIAAPDGTSVTGIEESTVNIGGSAGEPYGSSSSYRKKRRALYGSSGDGLSITSPSGSGTRVSNIEESSVNIHGVPFANAASVSGIEESRVNIGSSGYPPNQGNTAPDGTSVTGIEESTVNIGGSAGEPYGSSSSGSYRKKRRAPYGSSGDGSSITSPTGPNNRASEAQVSNIEESKVNINNNPSTNPTNVKNIEESTVNIGGSRKPADKGKIVPTGIKVSGIEESTINIAGSVDTSFKSKPSQSTPVPTDMDKVPPINVYGIDESKVNVGASVGEPYGSQSSSSGPSEGSASSEYSSSKLNTASSNSKVNGLRSIEESTINVQGKPTDKLPFKSIEESTINFGNSGKPANQGSSSGQTPSVDNVGKSTASNGGSPGPYEQPSPPVQSNSPYGSIRRRSVRSAPLVGGSFPQKSDPALRDTSIEQTIRSGLSALTKTTDKKVSKQDVKPNVRPVDKPIVPIMSEPKQQPQTVIKSEKSFKTVKSVITKPVTVDKSVPKAIKPDMATVNSQNIDKPTLSINSGVKPDTHLKKSGPGVMFSKSGIFVSNVEESFVNIGGEPDGNVVTTGGISEGFDMPDVTGYNCVKYPFREEGDTLIFGGIDYNCELAVNLKSTSRRRPVGEFRPRMGSATAVSDCPSWQFSTTSAGTINIEIGQGCNIVIHPKKKHGRKSLGSTKVSYTNQSGPGNYEGRSRL